MNKILGMIAVAGLAGVAQAQWVAGTVADLVNPVILNAGNSIDSGNHGDDVITALPAGFAFAFGSNNTPTHLISNGAAVTSNTNISFVNSALDTEPAGYYPNWDDWRTDNTTAGTGIRLANFPTMSIIQWTVTSFDLGGTDSAIFQIRMYGNTTGNATVRFVYFDMDTTGATHDFGQSATVGLIKRPAGVPATIAQWSFDSPNSTPSGRVLTYNKVPAPGALALLGLGGLVAGRRRR